jgi:uncharacterized protein
MFNLLPRDTVFFDLFENLSRHVVDTAQHLRRLAEEFPNVESAIAAIRREEHDADELAHTALARLDRAIITPYDREDIHTLINGLDDIVDEVDALAKRFKLYHVKSMDLAFRKQAEVLVAATLALNEAVHQLRKQRKLSDLSTNLIEIHRQENIGDENNHAAVSRLYEGDVPTLEVMKWKEMFDRVEKAIDECEDVANVLERIVLKHG